MDSKKTFGPCQRMHCLAFELPQCLNLSVNSRELVIKMQRIILRQLKNDVQVLQGPVSGELARYGARYQKEFLRYQRASSKKELIAEVSRADIVFGGDFHAFSQSQRTHLRILREVIRGKRDVILALEAVAAKHQNLIDRYIAGTLSETNFLKKISYAKNWGFPWENYRVFFELAQKNQLKVYGINYQTKIFEAQGQSDLEVRDKLSAAKIAEIKFQNQDSLVYVLYGDLHIAKKHLPQATLRALQNIGRKFSPKFKLKCRFLSIFQNSEKLYWKLADKKLEEKVEVLKLRKDAYCVVNTPPWLKWQAYLDFLEKRSGEDDSASLVDTIHGFCKFVCDILKIEGDFSDFHVFKKGDVGLAQYLSKKTNKKEKKFIEKMIQTNRPFFIPRLNIFYLTSNDTHRVVSLVGQFIHGQMRKEKRISLEMPQGFEALVWRETVGFFISKILNSRRKSQAEPKAMTSSMVALIAMEYRLKERVALVTGKKVVLVKRSRYRRHRHYYEAAALVGSLWGQKLYDAFIQGRVDSDRLRSWLAFGLEKKIEFHSFYLNVLGGISRLKLESVKPDERL